MDERNRVLGRRALLRGCGATAAVGLAGCARFEGPRTETGQSGSVTVLLDNADDTERPYEVTVDWGENNRSVFTGVLPPGATDSEMVATTGTAPESATFAIESSAGTRSGSWNPRECREYRVDAVIEAGEPAVETGCQG